MIDGRRDPRRQIHEAGLIRDLDAQALQIAGQSQGRARQEVPGSEARTHAETRGRSKRVRRARLGRICGGCRHDINLRPKAQLFDDLAPLPRLWKNAQSHMAHFGFPPPGTVPPQTGVSKPGYETSCLPIAYLKNASLQTLYPNILK